MNKKVHTGTRFVARAEAEACHNTELCKKTFGRGNHESRCCLTLHAVGAGGNHESRLGTGGRGEGGLVVVTVVSL